MKKIIALALALLTVFFFTACDDSPNVDEDISSEPISSEVQSNISSVPIFSETASDVTSEEKWPTDSSGNPLPVEYYLDENGKRQYFTKVKSLNFSEAEEDQTYSYIINLIRGLNAMNWIEVPAKNPDKSIDLSPHLISYAYRNIPKTPDFETYEINAKLAEEYGYPVMCGAYFKRTDIENLVDRLFCSDAEGFTLNKLDDYYHESIDRYGNPILDNFISQLPVVLEMTEENNKVRAKIIILYYVYYWEPDENNTNDIWDINKKIVGVYDKDQPIIDMDLLAESQPYEYTFCRTDEGLKLHSIKAVK